MANESEILWVDIENNALLSGWESNSVATTPTFKQGDNIKVEIHFVKRVSTQVGIFFEEVPTTGSSFKLAVGNPDSLPTGGFWSLGFGSETADFLYNASAASVQTALNAFTGITALGGVIVEKVNGDTTYRISFNDKVALTESFAGDASNLLPSSTVIADEIKVGSATTKGVWHIKPVQVPIAYQSTWTQQSSATITATTLQVGTTRVKISPSPKDGTFSLTVGAVNTAQISVFATELEVQTAITDAVTSGTFEVKKSGAFIWDVTQTDGTLVAITTDGAGLISFDAVVGELNFNNYETSSLLAGATSKNTTLEIEMTTGTTVATVLQTRCTIVANLIGENVFAPTPFEEHLSDAPEDGSLYARKDGEWVSFQEEDNQGITQGAADARYLQQSNNLSDLDDASAGRTNLGVYSTTEVDTALDAKANLSGATFTGKVNFTPVGGVAGLNVGIGGTNTSSVTAGDLWIATGGTNLNFRDGTGAWRVLATQGQTNTFSTNQIITGSTTSAMLRVTQTGTGESLRIEDETNPDATPFVVGADGRVGIHGTPAINTAHKLAIYNGNIVFSAGFGLAFGDGTTMTTAATGNVNSGSVNTFTTNQIIAGSSANAMLRITQTGTGEALRVEDSANPDSSAFIVDASGLVGIGGSPHGGTNFGLTMNAQDIRFQGGTYGITFNDGTRLTSAAGQTGKFFDLTDVSNFQPVAEVGDYPVVSVVPSPNGQLKFAKSKWWDGVVTMPSATYTKTYDSGDPYTSWSLTLRFSFTKKILRLHTGSLEFNVATSGSDQHQWTSYTDNYNTDGAYYGDTLRVLADPASSVSGWSYTSPEGFTVEVTSFTNLSYATWGDISEIINGQLGGQYRAYTESNNTYYDRPVTERGLLNALTLELVRQNAYSFPFTSTPRQNILCWNEDGTWSFNSDLVGTVSTIQSSLANYALLSGATFTGRVSTPNLTAVAPLRIGVATTAPTTTVAGDIWVGTNNLFFKDSTNVQRAVLNNNTVNTFTANQIISGSATAAMLRITQTGTGQALVVEDFNNPDTTAFIVNASGAVGIQRDPSTWAPTAGVNLDVSGAVRIDASTSAAPALYVSQLSTGFALLIEDETSPDATSTSIRGDGVVGIGLPYPWSPNQGEIFRVGGKGVFTPSATLAGINIGTVTATPTTLANGDIWIGNALNFRDANGINRACVVTNTSNTIQSSTTVNPILTVSQTGSTSGVGAVVINNSAPANALRITQTGAGNAIVVEDNTNPDSSATVIDQHGNLGVGVNPSSWTAVQKVEVGGDIRADNITFNGTAAFSIVSETSSTSFTQSHYLTIKWNGSTWRVPMEFVSTP